MAAIDFPSSPVTNQVFTANNTSWQWDGVTWVSYKPTSGNLIFDGGTLDAGVVSAGTNTVVPTSVLPNSLPSPYVTPNTPVVSNGNAWVSGSFSGLPQMQVFTSSGTFTVPAGVNKVKVTVVGGGGGGGGNSGVGAWMGGGGGGGAAIKIISGLTSGSTVAVTVGTGGTAGDTGGTAGGTGNTSSFGAFCSATGGVGSNGNNTSSSTGLGGLGSGGDLNIRGGPGGANLGSQTPNFSGSSILGGGVPSPTSGNGIAGGNYGGGGSGAGDATGGATLGAIGGAGVVIVEYLI